MKHAFATFVFIAGSIAAFAGSAYALPIIYATDGDPSKNVALEQDVDNFILRGGSIGGGSIALDQGANEWNHFIPRGGFSVALDQGANEWNHFVPKGSFKVALDRGANQWNHRGDDDWGCNPRRVL